MEFRKITVISNYPKTSDIKDGMMQRVVNIDDYFLVYDRNYLEISYRNNFSIKKQTVKPKVIEFKVNVFIHYFDILKILKNSKCLYVHSLFNFIKLVPFLPFIFKKNIILDFHGVVPEELKFQGKICKALLFSIVEYIAIRFSSHLIFVTQTMQDYISKKYLVNTYKAHVINIFSTNVFYKQNEESVNYIRNKYKINQTDVVFIYSGNTQKWQNIDLMFSIISKFAHVTNYKFLILTGNINIINDRLVQLGLLNQLNIIVASVLPNELGNYYALSHYGFILRDEHILNRVANPTKLVEYMYFGVIPIVKFEKIGDYKKLDYDYLKYDKLNSNMQQRKSSKNSKIIIKNSIKKFDMNTIVND